MLACERFWLIVATSISCSYVAKATTCTLLPNTSKLQCNVAGKLPYSEEEYWPLYLPQLVDSTEECAAVCARRKYIDKTWTNIGGGLCQGFRYNSHTKLCQLGYDLPEIIPQSNSQNVFSNIRCFDCGDHCDQPYGTNLLDNGDFQSPLLGPWSGDISRWRGEAARLGHGPGGAKYLECGTRPNSSVSYVGCYLYQDFNVCAGKFYAIQLDYRAMSDNASGKAHIGVGIDAFVDIYTDASTDAESWKTVRFYQQISYQDDDYAHYGAYDVRTGPFALIVDRGSFDEFPRQTVSIDNVKITHVPKQPALVKPERNLIENGGFESGQFSPWIRKNRIPTLKNGNISSPGINSNYGFYIHYSDQDYQTSLSQQIATIPGKSYLLSYQYLGKTGNHPYAGGTSDDNLIHLVIKSGEYEVTHSIPHRMGLQNRTLPITAASTKTTIKFITALISGYSRVVLDNFRFVEIAESDYFPGLS